MKNKNTVLVVMSLIALFFGLLPHFALAFLTGADYFFLLWTMVCGILLFVIMLVVTIVRFIKSKKIINFIPVLILLVLLALVPILLPTTFYKKLNFFFMRAKFEAAVERVLENPNALVPTKIGQSEDKDSFFTDNSYQFPSINNKIGLNKDTKQVYFITEGAELQSGTGGIFYSTIEPKDGDIADNIKYQIKEQFAENWYYVKWFIPAD